MKKLKNWLSFRAVATLTAVVLVASVATGANAAEIPPQAKIPAAADLIAPTLAPSALCGGGSEEVVIPDVDGVRYETSYNRYESYGDDQADIRVIALDTESGDKIGAWHLRSNNLCLGSATFVPEVIQAAEKCGVNGTLPVPPPGTTTRNPIEPSGNWEEDGFWIDSIEPFWEMTDVVNGPDGEPVKATYKFLGNNGFPGYSWQVEQTTITLDATATPCPTEATPVAPELVPSEVCDVEGTVRIEETEGVTYTQTRNGNIVTVTATANEGFVFAEGVQTTWDIEIPEVVPCDEQVIPVAPKLVPSEVCDVEGTVSITEVEGVTYTQTRDGNTVTVTAVANEGYVFAEGTQGTWDIEIPEIVPCPEAVVPVAPKLVPSEVCDIEGTISITEVEGVSYKQTRDGNKVTVVATANEGFTFAEGTTTTWDIEIPEVVPCPEVVVPVAPELVPSEVCDVEGTVRIEETEGVTYTQTRDGNIVTVTATANEGFVFAEGTQTTWDIEIPEVTPCPEAVVPVAPKLIPSEVCDAEGTVSITEVDGVSYTQTREGNIVTVVATANEGFVIEDGVQTTWDIEIPEVVPCPEQVVPVAPKLVPSEVCDVEGTVSITEVDGVTYTQTRDGSIVTVVATANEGYVFAEGATTTWDIEIPEVVPCPEAVVPVAPKLVPAEVCDVEGTVSITEVDGVSYTQTREGNNVTVVATANEGFVIEDGVQATWTIEIPDVVPCPEQVVPVAPKLVPSEVCDVEGTVSITEVEGVTYTQTRVGNIVTVTAKVNEGFVFAEETTTTWDIEIPEVVPCPTPPPATEEPTVPPVTPEQTEPPVAPAEPTETPKALANTGTDGVVFLIGGAFALMLAGLGIMLINKRRRNGASAQH